MVYNIERLSFKEIDTFEIIKLKNNYKCIRRDFEINDYILEQKKLESTSYLDFIEKTYYEGTNALGRKVYFIEKKENCNKAIKMIKSSEN